MIEKADYQRLMEIEAERKALIEKMMPHAKAVADAYYGHSVENVAFGPKTVFVAIDEDSAGSFDANLLFDPEWERKIAEIRELERQKCESIMAKMAEDGRKRQEARDRQELARLLAKYPDAVTQGRPS